MASTKLPVPLLLLVTAACNEHDLSRVNYEDYFVQEGTDEADILFVIDDSISMADEQRLVAQGFNRFIAGIGDEQVDFHLGIVSTDMDLSNPGRATLVGPTPFLTPEDDYVPEFMERVQVGTDGSDKERGLQAAYETLYNERGGSSSGFLRSSAVLALVFVSDENDCSDDNHIPDSADGSHCYDNEDALVPTADYIRGYYEIKDGGAGVMASAIVGPDAADGCDGSWPGRRYRTVAEMLGGAVGDICDSDFGEIMDEIGGRITSPRTVFPLRYAAVSDSIEVEVSGEMIAEDVASGWTYDNPTYSILFSGSYVPPFGSEIWIRYEVAGEVDLEDSGG